MELSGHTSKTFIIPSYPGKCKGRVWEVEIEIRDVCDGIVKEEKK